MKRALTLIVASVLFFNGCENEKEAKLVSTVENNKQEKVDNAKVAPFKAALKVQKSDLTAFYKVFKDGAKIAPENGKYMLLVFGQPADPFTVKFQKDIKENRDLANKIKNITTPIYIDATATKLHKLMHNGKLMDADTKTLVTVYGIDSTPTIIFANKEGKTVFVVPGYMPPKQFMVTLDFLKSEKWKGKDQKNGAIYKALKDFYVAHNIKIKEAKK